MKASRRRPRSCHQRSGAGSASPCQATDALKPGNSSSTTLAILPALARSICSRRRGRLRRGRRLGAHAAPAWPDPLRAPAADDLEGDVAAHRVPGEGKAAAAPRPGSGGRSPPYCRPSTWLATVTAAPPQRRAVDWGKIRGEQMRPGDEQDRHRVVHARLRNRVIFGKQRPLQGTLD